MRRYLLSKSIDAPMRAARRADRDSQAGFTLIEVLVSATIIAFIAAAVATGLIANASVSADQRRHSEADQLAQQDQERLKGLSSKQLFGLNQNWNITVDGTTYNGTSQATFLSSAGASTCSPAGLGAASYYNVVSTVTWGTNHRTPIKEESIITPPAGGALLTQVKDQNQNPVQGIGVSASGPDFESALTDAMGCTIFGGLPTGQYTVALSLPSGWVDPEGDPTPTDTAQVTSTGTAAPDHGNPMHAALAGTLNANFTTVANTGTVSNPVYGTIAGQKAHALSWYGNGAVLSMADSQALVPTTVPAAPIPASPSLQLFPFAFAGPSYTGNYQVWAGNCRAMEPPRGIDTFNVAPGSSQTVTVQEPALNVSVTLNGTAIKPDNVVMNFTGSASCNETTTASTDSWRPPVVAPTANGVLAYPGQPFVTSVAGSSPGASASGQTGSITVCADVLSSNKIYSGSSTPTTNSNFAQPTPVSVVLTQTGVRCP
jgi:prepilin-type N-terminal cleavage/methylation domain-containing protein